MDGYRRAGPAGECDMIGIKSMTQAELGAWLKQQGEPGFRARQIFT